MEFLEEDRKKRVVTELLKYHRADVGPVLSSSSHLSIKESVADIPINDSLSGVSDQVEMILKEKAKSGCEPKSPACGKLISPYRSPQA